MALKLSIAANFTPATDEPAIDPAVRLLGETAAAARAGVLTWPSVELRAQPGLYTLTMQPADTDTAAYLTSTEVGHMRLMLVMRARRYRACMRRPTGWQLAGCCGAPAWLMRASSCDCLLWVAPAAPGRFHQARMCGIGCDACTKAGFVHACIDGSLLLSLLLSRACAPSLDGT